VLVGRSTRAENHSRGPPGVLLTDSQCSAVQRSTAGPPLGLIVLLIVLGCWVLGCCTAGDSTAGLLLGAALNPITRYKTAGPPLG
jgi:hypothetical protein